MGVVWRARDEHLGRDVAVKELAWPGNRSADEQRAACRHATREAQAAARLSHRNVIRVFDITKEGGSPWIVMELLPPWSLQDLIEQRGPLGPDLTAEIGLSVLAALRAAHAAGIVHRDVKPANVVLAPDRVVLTDFGIARVSGPSALTTTDILIGSPSIHCSRAREGRTVRGRRKTCGRLVPCCTRRLRAARPLTGAATRWRASPPRSPTNRSPPLTPGRCCGR